MSFYADIDAGTIHATLVLAVPRSVSSALAKAISISTDVDLYIFHPLYKSGIPEKELEEYLAKAKSDKAANPGNPIHVVMKETAESISGHRFPHLMKRCDNICTLVRDPQSQALSAFRAFNNYYSGKDVAADELQQLKRMRSTKALADYIVVPWERMGRHVKQLEAHSHEKGTSQNWCVVDGDLVRTAPKTILSLLCQNFGMAYSRKMIEGWKVGGDKTVGLHGQHYNRHWVGRMQQSAGLRKPTSMTPRLEDFSREVRAQIESNLETYVRVLANEHTLALPPEHLTRLMKRGGFQDTCPVACYTLVALWPNAFSALKDRSLEDIRQQKPGYASSFDIVDKTVERHVVPERGLMVQRRGKSGAAARHLAA